MEATPAIKVTATLDKVEYGTIDVEYEQFSRIPTTVGVHTTSPNVELGEHLWAVEICPGGHVERMTGNVSCFLVNANKRSLQVCATFGILDTAGAIHHTERLDEFNIEAGSSYGIGDFVPLSTLNSSSETLLAGDTLQIRIVFHSVTTVGHRNVMADSTHVYWRQSFLTESHYETILGYAPADASIIVNGDADNALPVQSYVLALHSPVFRAMFQSSMQEAQGRTIEITDFPEPVVRAFVRFLYEDRCAKSTLQEHALRVLAMADKYEVKPLFAVCEHYLSRTLTIANVCELATLAEQRNALQLRAAVVESLHSHITEAYASPNRHLVPIEVLWDVIKLQVAK